MNALPSTPLHIVCCRTSTGMKMSRFTANAATMCRRLVETYGIEWEWPQAVALWIEVCKEVVDLEMVSVSLFWAGLVLVQVA